MNTQEVIEKYFKGERQLYFQSSDAMTQIEGDTYLRYEKTGKIELWFGGNNGEVCLLCTTNGESLENLIKAIIYG
jgi:hypothetical protein